MNDSMNVDTYAPALNAVAVKSHATQPPMPQAGCLQRQAIIVSRLPASRHPCCNACLNSVPAASGACVEQRVTDMRENRDVFRSHAKCIAQCIGS